MAKLPEPRIDTLAPVPGFDEYFIRIDVLVPNIRTIADRANQAIETRQAEQVPLHVWLIDDASDLEAKVRHGWNQRGHLIDLRYNPSLNRSNDCRLHGPPVSHITVPTLPSGYGRGQLQLSDK
jgi:hypothetical protein